MDTSSPSRPLRLGRSYEEIILTLTEAEARLVLGLGPEDFWTWYERRSDDRPTGLQPEGARR
jgi:hypothetical protein